MPSVVKAVRGIRHLTLITSANELIHFVSLFLLQCENDGEVEYEFPCYNLVDRIEGLWDSQDPRYQENSCYGGVRLRTQQGTCHLLHSLFPRLQVGIHDVCLRTRFGRPWLY